VFGRLVALADVYDALSSKRAYKERWDEAQVLDELKVGSGAHFDPEMVDTFFECIDTIRNIARTVSRPLATEVRIPPSGEHLLRSGARSSFNSHG